MDSTARAPNRLIGERSPYLLQHAHNPVDWWPWCPEAFARAALEDKPVFLSIGYSTCHWCHVMAHESFEDEETAALLKAGFIAVKVDREERPDVDSVYMDVCQLLTGSGGWPLTVLMTPDQTPFFAGTYFPKHSVSGQVGLYELLTAVAERWIDDRATLLRSGARIVEALRADAPPPAVRTSPEGLLEAAASHYRQHFDEAFGGFSPPPKFPVPHALLFLLELGDEEGRRMACRTLRAMQRGGLYDHVGGGFSRYATDRAWLVPHFEKMLYDNALLLMAYSRAYELTGEELFARVARRTAQWVRREMTAPEGGFYSAQDADSGGGEGRYYLFTPQEAAAALGGDAGRLCSYFGITREGNFQGSNILNLLGTVEYDQSVEALTPRLLAFRAARMPLGRDEKVLPAWNAMMIAGLACAHTALGDGAHLAMALAALGHVGAPDPRWFLDDYAFLCWARLCLHDATLQEEHLEAAAALAREALALFPDETGGFYMTREGAETLILRPKELQDAAMPCGNSVMAYCLARLSLLTHEEEFARAAQAQVAFLCSRAAAYPAGHAFFLYALLLHLRPPRTILCVPGPGDDPAALGRALPPGGLRRVLPGPTPDFPLLRGGRAYYVCEGRVCHPPAAML